MSFRAAILHRIADWVPSDEARSKVYRASGLTMGKDVFIGEGCLFDKLVPGNVVIGDRVAIGARSVITAHQTTVTARDLSVLYPDKEFTTTIEHDCWLMPGVTITPGVTVGHHSVIATGVVVHKDVPPYSVVVGPGFRIAKTLSPEDLHA
ncbi:acyltransferase [Nocardioides cynanchi]|uniref:acyltransferase n=1 Tax=Nocardioides cynanchi TaxID=2558918 RepID=UPI00178065BE|nr:acyltransferase [Nocardioides cynanchi]